jgi:hypothetical protein
MHPIKTTTKLTFLLYEKCSEIILDFSLFLYSFCKCDAFGSQFFFHIYNSLRKPFLSSNQIIPWLLLVLYGYLNPNVRTGDFRPGYQKPLKISWVLVF